LGFGNFLKNGISKGGNMSKKRIICLILGIVAAAAISLTPAPEGLTVEAMRGIGILICGIFWMSGGVFPEYAVMIAMLAFWVITKVLPFSTAFAAYSGTSFWLLTGAMVIGIAGSKSGLLLRIALLVLKIFPANYSGQVLAFLTSGLVISPLVPSTAAKAAIMGPIAKQISDAMGYEDKSKGAAGLFGAYFTGYTCFGPIFMSGSFIAYSMLGALPEEYVGSVSWMQWLYYALPWSIVVIVLSYVALLVFFSPPNDIKIDTENLRKMKAELGAMKREEKITLGVLLGCLLLWIMERSLGISSAAVAVVGMTVLIATKVIGIEDFNKRVSWNLVFFIGAVMNIGTMITALNIDDFLGERLGPIMLPLVSQPLLFVLAFVIIIVLARFVIASTLTSTVLFTVIAVSFTLAAGIHPWCVGFIAYVSVHVWFVKYQMPLFLTATAVAGNGEMITQKQAAMQSLIYIVISTLGLLLCIPWWKFLGLMA